MILHSEIEPGTALSEEDTAARLGVSRTPVREALRELLNEGLLQNEARRQVAVATPTPEVVREIALVRRALECIVVTEASSVISESDIDKLRLIAIRTQRNVAAEHVHHYLDCDDEFHLAIASAANFPLIEDTLSRLRAMTRLAHTSTDWAPQMSTSVAYHEALINALDHHDTHSALALVQNYLADGPMGNIEL